MRKILWLVSLTLPQAAAACGLENRQVGGGWLTGQLAALRGLADLTVCSLDARVTAPAEGEAGGVRYLLLPDASHFEAVLARRRPDLVHIWGTEYAAAADMQRAAGKAGLPVLVGIQGVMAECARHLCDGVPERYLRSCFLQRCIDRAVPGALLDKSQRQFDALAKSEAKVLAHARHVTGRTSFDRRASAALAPRARYHPCNETLRPAFYTGTIWHPREFGSAPVLFMPQGNYPLKNLHTALQAMPAVLRRWPDAVLRVAGWPPLDKGPLLRPVIDWMFPYQRWCKRLVRQLGLEGHLQYTGPLQEAEMRQAYLDADLFLLPSSCENSPNSLGEAMLLGLPCVASGAGGIPDMIGSGEGLLYGDAQDAAALADAVCTALGLPDGGAALGAAARRRALATHDPAANAAAMLAIYEQICEGSADGV